MNEQDLNCYIKKLELLRELESKNLIRSEVIIMHRDRIVAEMLQVVSSQTKQGSESHLPSFPSETPPPPVPSSQDYIFISYSHKDKKWLEKLHLFVAPLVQQGKLHLWSDTQIDPGNAW